MIATVALVLCAASFAAALSVESTRFSRPAVSITAPATASQSHG